MELSVTSISSKLYQQLYKTEMRRNTFEDITVRTSHNSNTSNNSLFNLLRARINEPLFLKRFEPLDKHLEQHAKLSENNTIFSVVQPIPSSHYCTVFGESNFLQIARPQSFEFILQEGKTLAVAVGVGLEDILKPNRLEGRWDFADYRKTGVYMLGALGFSGQHGSEEFGNKAGISFLYTVGDVVRVTYDPANRSLLFEKNPTEGTICENFKMENVPPETKPCVLFGNSDIVIKIQ